MGGFKQAPGSPFPVGPDPDSVAVGDFNGDGILDLAIGHEDNNTVTVLLGNGIGGHQTPLHLSQKPFQVVNSPVWYFGEPQAYPKGDRRMVAQREPID
jgi:hypothetical protein